MYEKYYHLKAEPFRMSPDHRFCYKHKSYAKAKAYMLYAFQRAEGFVMITGRPGTGKTTLVSDLTNKLPKDKIRLAMLVCTQLEANDLLHMVAASFGVPGDIERKSQILQKMEALLRGWYQEGKRALLIIDEAQDLKPSALEELRLLTNIQINNKPLLQIFLLGQEELRDMIQQKSMEQVHQRIVAACHLKPLDISETKSYIKHRLQRVGWQNDPAISEAVYPVVHKFSGGIPRRINMICSRLFLHGCVEDLHKIGIKDAESVMLEIKQEQLTAEEIPDDLDFSQTDIYEQPTLASVDQMDTARKGTAQGKAVTQKPPPSPPATDRSGPSEDLVEKFSRSKDIRTSRYFGPESRKSQRRSGSDRRQEVRFDPANPDRRSNPGRRSEDIAEQKFKWRYWKKYDK
ncbi:MAG: AAA family ATPase [bacterium]